VFSMSYGGQRYSASAPLSATKLKKGAWTHLAFGWDLPVVSIADPSRPDFQANVAKYGPALVLAAGLTKPSPSTFQRQQGQGKLMIYANGKLVASSPLGSAASQRDCLASGDVVGTRQYDADGEAYPPFSPYASYDNSPVSNGVEMGLGTLCKAYRVRNEQAFFGCAQSSSGVNADADMDDITLIWGPGRTKFDDVGEGGAPKLWPIGSSYGSK
jgi:hypothetical protein